MSAGQFQGLYSVGCLHTCWLPQAEGKKTVPLEVQKDIIHNKRGILSMGRHSDPNSGGSSFSILLGPAPHLDQEYTIFGCAFVPAPGKAGPDPQATGCPMHKPL